MQRCPDKMLRTKEEDSDVATVDGCTNGGKTWQVYIFCRQAARRGACHVSFLPTIDCNHGTFGKGEQETKKEILQRGGLKKCETSGTREPSQSIEEDQEYSCHQGFSGYITRYCDNLFPGSDSTFSAEA